MGERVAMLSGVSRLDDASFMYSAWNGLKEARERMGVETTIIESSIGDDPSDEIAHLVREGYGLILAIGFITSEAVTQIARRYPGTGFAIIDASEEAELPQNVVRVLFRENEGALLAGVVAGMSSTTGRVGFVGGKKIPVVRRFQAGYAEGLERSGGTKLKSVFTDSFVSYSAGRKATVHLIGERCDIIFHAAGASGKGVIREVSDAGLRAIGCDIDQSFLAPATVITSVVKRLDQTIPAIISEWLKDDLELGVERSYGIAEGAIGITPIRHVSDLSAVNEQVERVRAEYR